MKQLQKIQGISIAVKEHEAYKEYYEITIEQPLDHFNNTDEVFKQRFYLGINSTAAATIMETQGYGVGKTAYPFIKGCNIVDIEHRYYGKSKPDSLNWAYLTIKQAAYDCHHIRELLAPVLKGKWLSTGISKGGQTAIAYKMYFPDDVDATLAHVTPIKNGINDRRLNEYMHSLQATECGAKVYTLRNFIFQNKGVFVEAFSKRVVSDFDNETVLDYMLLEYPFAFFQNGFNCASIPDTAAAPMQIMQAIMEVVPPTFYSATIRPRLEPSFYMFYHELGYYEYDLSMVEQWLKHDAYPNNIFAPTTVVPMVFDTTYQNNLNRFIASPNAEKIIFVYGELDPYTAAKANSKYVFIVKGGCHKSRVIDLSATQQQKVFALLSEWLNFKIEN